MKQVNHTSFDSSSSSQGFRRHLSVSALPTDSRPPQPITLIHHPTGMILAQSPVTSALPSPLRFSCSPLPFDSIASDTVFTLFSKFRSFSLSTAYDLSLSYLCSFPLQHSRQGPSLLPFAVQCYLCATLLMHSLSLL